MRRDFFLMQRLNYKTFVYILSFAHFQENSGRCVLFEMIDEKRQNVFRAFCADRICFVACPFLMLICCFLKMRCLVIAVLLFYLYGYFQMKSKNMHSIHRRALFTSAQLCDIILYRKLRFW